MPTNADGTVTSEHVRTTLVKFPSGPENVDGRGGDGVKLERH